MDSHHAQRELAEAAQLRDLAAEFPGYEVRRIFGGFAAYPAGAVVVMATDLDGIADKLRQHGRPDAAAAAVAALAEAARSEHDFGGWLSLVLVRAAARLGSLDDLTAGRPGSWEAAHVDALARGLAGDDDGLEAYREP